MDCPNRRHRHRAGKSDAIDAVSAARAALSGEAQGRPKGGTGPVEAMRVLLIAKRSARAERVRALNQIRQMIYVAPDDVRALIWVAVASVVLAVLLAGSCAVGISYLNLVDRRGVPAHLADKLERHQQALSSEGDRLLAEAGVHSTEPSNGA